MLLLLAAPAGPAPALDDAWIARALGEALEDEASVPAGRVHAEVHDGVAHLDGTVATVLARDRAAAVAERVRGVRSVVNAVEVSPVAREDDAIAEAVRAVWRADPALPADSLSVEVESAVVTLGGSVATGHLRRFAAAAARGVPGVRAVHNEVVVEPHVDRSDDALRAEIQQRLAWDLRIGIPRYAPGGSTWRATSTRVPSVSAPRRR